MSCQPVIPPSFTAIQESLFGAEISNQSKRRRKNEAFRLSNSRPASLSALVAGLRGEPRRARRTTDVVMCALAAAWISQAATTAAAPPPNITPNPALHAWFESLKQPGTQLPCCSISDCHFTDYREKNGHFEVTIDDWPYVVPDQAVLRMGVSPTAQAVVCYGYASFGFPTSPGEVRTAPQDPIEILCFVPEKSTS
jgi:hypothetical protein